MSVPVQVSLSALDEERFGIRTAKTGSIREEDIPAVIEFCRETRVELLIARCPTGDLKAAQDLEGRGFGLMDTLVYYHRRLKKDQVTSDTSPVLVRHFRPGEEDVVKAVAADSFKGYLGHYHTDPRLDRAACDDTYTDWAYRSCISRDVADMVLIAESDGDIAGFATMKKKGSSEGEGVLFGVAPRFQGKGIYRLLMIGGMQWCHEERLEAMTVSTQITNTAVQKVWVRLGFEPSYSFYTFHKWFTKR